MDFERRLLALDDRHPPTRSDQPERPRHRWVGVVVAVVGSVIVVGSVSAAVVAVVGRVIVGQRQIDDTVLIHFEVGHPLARGFGGAHKPLYVALAEGRRRAAH